jgi:hypothetical protein
MEQVARQSTVLHWFVPLWHAKPVWRHAFDSLLSFSFGPFPPYTAISSVGSSVTVAGAVMAAVLVRGVYSLRGSAAMRVCLLASGLALVAPIAYSLLLQPVFIPGRTDHYLHPIFLLLVATGVADISERRLPRIGVVLLFCALSLWVLVPYYETPTKNASRSYMEEVKKVAAPGDILIATGCTVAVSEYYALKWDLPVVFITYPLSLIKHPGFFNPEDEASRPDDLASDAESLVAAWKDSPSAIGKGIILLTPDRINRVLLSALSREFRFHDALGAKRHREALLRVPVRILVAKDLPP